MRWNVGARIAAQEARAERLAVLRMEIDLLERQIEGAGMWLPFSARRYEVRLSVLAAEAEALRAAMEAAEQEGAYQQAEIAEEERREEERRAAEKRRREAQRQEEQRLEEERREERRRAAEREQRMEARRLEERRPGSAVGFAAPVGDRVRQAQPASAVDAPPSFKASTVASVAPRISAQVPSPSTRPAAQGTASRERAVGEEVRAVVAESAHEVMQAPPEPPASVRASVIPPPTRQAAPALPVKVAAPVHAASGGAHPAMTGADLVAWRKERGLTQQAVAMLLNTTQGNLSKVESRRTASLSPEWIALLAAHR